DGVYSFTVDGIGTYTFAADGSWTFAPENNQLNPADASFRYRITDGDGDTDNATQTITVTDGDGPTGGDKATLEVDERDLDTASTGDLAAGSVNGSTPNDTGETDSDTLSFSAGSDALTTFTFGSTAGIGVSGLLGAPVITWVGAGTDTLIGRINGVDAIIV